MGSLVVVVGNKAKKKQISDKSLIIWYIRGFHAPCMYYRYYILLLKRFQGKKNFNSKRTWRTCNVWAAPPYRCTHKIYNHKNWLHTIIIDIYCVWLCVRMWLVGNNQHHLNINIYFLYYQIDFGIIFFVFLLPRTLKSRPNTHTHTIISHICARHTRSSQDKTDIDRQTNRQTTPAT